MKKDDLEVGKDYTYFGISLTMSTKKIQFRFSGYTEAGNIRYRKMEGSAFLKGSFWLPTERDMIILPGTSLQHGIYADFEIPTHNGVVMAHNNSYNLAVKDMEKAKELLSQHLTPDQLTAVCLYQISGSIRPKHGLYVFREMEEPVL